MTTERVRVLIWGKTYPELSAKHIETVCTAGVREDGRPIRLYPVPLRYLNTQKQFALYDWIEASVEKSTADPRPESYKVNPSTMKIVGHLDPGTSWTERKVAVFKDASWQFDCMDDLVREEAASKRSLGIIRPGSIEGVDLVRKGTSAEKEYNKKMNEVLGQGDLFHRQYKELEYLPYNIRLRWRCRDRSCSCSSSKPHDNLTLDWGLLELARKRGWPMAKQKLEEVADLDRKDVRLFIGNYRLHPKSFGVVGLWYPKLQQEIQDQMKLF